MPDNVSEAGDPEDGTPAGADVTPVHDEPSVDEEIELVEGEPVENTTLRRIAKALPPERRAEFFAVIRRERISHSGWLPTPEYMKEYDLALPGLAERIVALPEREQGFRHATTADIVKRDYRLRTTGQWMGMAALCLVLAFCTFLTVWGFGAAAAWVAGTVIVGTVGIFVTGQLIGSNSSSKDLVES
jgi:uncharacterized membrane protein